ncbi:PIG-L deacetylase family protein [Nocardia panacis]|nr:PIG-L deacetylase family protein [Nocardia panacis]
MSLLAIGAHPDDVELGCGATLLLARRAGLPVTVVVMTDGSRGPGGVGVRAAEQRCAATRLGATLIMLGYPDGRLAATTEVIGRLEAIIAVAAARIVLTHAREDSHQDHRAAAEATVAAARAHSQVLHYESPTTLGFAPTLFAEVTGVVADKLDLLREHRSQVLGSARVDLAAISALATVRGAQGRVGAAEAFVPTRARLALPDIADLTDIAGARVALPVVGPHLDQEAAR